MHLIFSLITALAFSIGVGEIPYTAIERGFETNNPSEIVKYGKEKILINVLGKEGAYSQSQAGLVLKDFFTKNPGSKFEFYFKGKESADGSFAIGNYTSKGQSYRVTVHFKKLGSDYKIESLTIENS
jgi:hypothetical protein